MSGYKSRWAGKMKVYMQGCPSAHSELGKACSHWKTYPSLTRPRPLVMTNTKVKRSAVSFSSFAGCCMTLSQERHLVWLPQPTIHQAPTSLPWLESWSTWFARVLLANCNQDVRDNLNKVYALHTVCTLQFSFGLFCLPLVPLQGTMDRSSWV